MDPTTLGIGIIASSFLLFSRKGNKSTEDSLIFAKQCNAASWAVLQALETAINVPRASKLYPLSRYWLNLEEIDYQRGNVSASLEFVEEVRRTRTLTGKTKDRVFIKKFGFVWVIEEIFLANQVQLAVSLYWKDLSTSDKGRNSFRRTSRKSSYEENILQGVIELTREIVQRADRSSVSTGTSPISGPPPAPGLSAGNLVGPPPLAVSGASAVQSASTQIHASNPGQPSLRASFGGRRQSNKLAFKHMSRTVSMSTEEHAKRLVEWPNPQDYHEAIQNPSFCFELESLQVGMPELDQLGMPRVSSGAFASVYKIRSEHGDKAVRCFLHPLKDQKYRYGVLSQAVGPEIIPWTVNFEFHDQGIRIGNSWYPILVMDWVEGTPLNIYVASLCNERNTDALESLRQKFARMSRGLRIANVAHGDLQHGNILVRNGELLLVDYDGMYVPGLKEKSSNELGHPNYQHPARNDKDFNELIDHFSSWVIDSALLCLQEDPGLWEFNDDGESLLFHRHDFVCPERSPLLIHLSAHSSLIIRKRMSFFRDLLERELFEIPPLEGEILPILEVENPCGRQNEPLVKSSGLPDWLSGTDID